MFGTLHVVLGEGCKPSTCIRELGRVQPPQLSSLLPTSILLLFHVSGGRHVPRGVVGYNLIGYFRRVP